MDRSNEKGIIILVLNYNTSHARDKTIETIIAPDSNFKIRKYFIIIKEV